MAFYIKPPEGFGSLEKLRLYAARRMSFLGDVLACADAQDFKRLLEKGSTAVDSDCLIEGSRKDRTSHFLLRLICCTDPQLSAFFIQAETELFCHRFSCMNLEELGQLLSSSHRFLSRLQKRQSQMSPIIAEGKRGGLYISSAVKSLQRMSNTQALVNLFDVLSRILQTCGKWEKAVKAYLEYSSEIFKVPFQHALCLVASRKVRLKHGMAFVQFSELHVVMAAMFEAVVREGIKIACRFSQHLEEDRIRSICDAARRVFFMMHPRASWNGGLRTWGILKECQVDQLHYLFPPCMSHLHRTLRSKHRLRHFSRVQYTLFLKEIGLPVQDAIIFWQREYSQPPSCHGNGGGCQHSWSQDERRYRYNIRHLYGLEGSRRDYRAHSCRAIQGMELGFGEEGGCPMKHCDDASLQKMMDIEDIVEPQRDWVLYHRQNKNFGRACGTYLSAKLLQLHKECCHHNSHLSREFLEGEKHQDDWKRHASGSKSAPQSETFADFELGSSKLLQNKRSICQVESQIEPRKHCSVHNESCISLDAECVCTKERLNEAGGKGRWIDQKGVVSQQTVCHGATKTVQGIKVRLKRFSEHGICLSSCYDGQGSCKDVCSKFNLNVDEPEARCKHSHQESTMCTCTVCCYSSSGLSHQVGKLSKYDLGGNVAVNTAHHTKCNVPFNDVLSNHSIPQIEEGVEVRSKERISWGSTSAMFVTSEDDTHTCKGEKRMCSGLHQQDVRSSQDVIVKSNGCSSKKLGMFRNLCRDKCSCDVGKADAEDKLGSIIRGVQDGKKSGSALEESCVGDQIDCILTGSFMPETCVDEGKPLVGIKETNLDSKNCPANVCSSYGVHIGRHIKECCRSSDTVLVQDVVSKQANNSKMGISVCRPPDFFFSIVSN